jgi:lycopene cyclase domain-containing protein
VVPWRAKLADAAALLPPAGVARMLVGEVALRVLAVVADWGGVAAALLATWLATELRRIEGLVSYGRFHALWTAPALAAAALFVAVVRPWWLRRRGRPRAAYAGAPPDARLLLPWTAGLAAVAVAYTTPWDAALIARGVWRSDAVAGAALLGVPCEEYAFFVAATAFTALCWAAVWPARWRDVPLGATPPLAPLVALGAAAAAGGGLLAASERTLYAGALLLWATPVLALQWAVGGHVLIAHADPLARCVLLSGGALALLDAWAIRRNVWVLNPEWSLPPWGRGAHVEEAAFFLLTSAMAGGGLTLGLWAQGGFAPPLRLGRRWVVDLSQGRWPWWWPLREAGTGGGGCDGGGGGKSPSAEAKAPQRPDAARPAGWRPKATMAVARPPQL